jgi:hypothetical protein
MDQDHKNAPVMNDGVQQSAFGSYTAALALHPRQLDLVQIHHRMPFHKKLVTTSREHIHDRLCPRAIDQLSEESLQQS